MKTFDLPNGPGNFKQIDFKNTENYSVEFQFEDGTTIISNNEIDCCCNKHYRIFFINYLGRVDAINFGYVEETFESKSDSWQKSLSFPLVKSDGGTRRMNLKSNESYKATNNCYKEEDMEWIKELLASPLAWLQWKGTENQPDDYLPIEITDKKFTTKKNEQRYVYEIVIEFKMANENSHIRT